jgi:hypothetical protein
MEEHKLKKTILTCAHHAALRTHASAPVRASACRRFKRSKLQKKTLCEVLKKLAGKYGKLATPVRSTRLPSPLPRGGAAGSALSCGGSGRRRASA